MEQVFHTESIFDELEHVTKITTSSKISQGLEPNTKQLR
jgi:hypothetical protein